MMERNYRGSYQVRCYNAIWAIETDENGENGGRKEKPRY
jgi:hypothetical protein